MGTTKATKAADKSQVCRKFVNGDFTSCTASPFQRSNCRSLKRCCSRPAWKTIPGRRPKLALKKLIGSFFDLNEIRVSSVNELELVLAPLNKADWKGLRNSVHSAIHFRNDVFVRLRKTATTDIGAGCQNPEEDAGHDAVHS